MSPMHGPTQEHLRFLAAKAIIERARARAGVRLPPYTRAQWDREQQQLRASVARKRRIQREKAERVAMFESRIHGVKLTEAS
jgi:hypothetical protein